MAVKYLQGIPWVTKHRAGNSTLCSQHANPPPPFPSFPACWIYCVLFASLPPCAGWCFSDLELGRLRNVILVLAGDWGALAGLPTQMQIDWKCSLSEEPSAQPKSKQTSFFPPFLPTVPHFHVKIRQEYHFKNIFTKIQQAPSFFLKHPMNLMQSPNALPLGRDVRWPGERWLVAGSATRMVSQYRTLGFAPSFLVLPYVLFGNQILSGLKTTPRFGQAFGAHCPKNVNEGILHSSFQTNAEANLE